MKIIIFGATGTVGRQLVKQSLRDGHAVTAFARHPEKLDIAHPRLSLFPGDVLNEQTVSEAVAGHDGVIVTLGAGRHAGVRANGTRHIVTAMTEHRVGRLVCMSSLGAGESWQALNWFWKYLMFGILLRPALADHNEQEAIVRNADPSIDWVIVRPGAFTDGALTGNYRTGQFDRHHKPAGKISRADLSDFLVKQLNDTLYIGQATGISY
ncbi:MAG: NAD(P)-dependent oxidoreductase [Burkholderiaceae bacterium]